MELTQNNLQALNLLFSNSIVVSSFFNMKFRSVLFKVSSAFANSLKLPLCLDWSKERYLASKFVISF